MYKKQERVTVRASGGLGNQLFMLTAAEYLRIKFPEVDVRVDLSSIGQKAATHPSDILNLNLPAFLGREINESEFLRSGRVERIIQSTILRKGMLSLEETGFVTLNLLRVPRPTTIVGYFQSENYLSLVRQHGAPLLIKPQNASSEYEQEIKRVRSATWATVHVRRGDYLKHSNSLGLLEVNYFGKAIEVLINSGFENFLLISNDPDWLSSNILSLPEANYHQLTKSSGLTDEEVLAISSNTKGFVMSNSSFSFWGALAGVKKTVIAPSPWYKNMPQPTSLFASDGVTLIPSVWSN
jgi:hypothetical protein